MLTKAHKAEFERVREALRIPGQLMLMDCTEKATGKQVAVLCMTVPPEIAGGEYVVYPLLPLFDGDPMELLEPLFSGNGD